MKRLLIIILLLAGCYRVPPEPELELTIETYPPYWPVVTVEMKDMHDWFWWLREPPYCHEENTDE